VFQLRDLTQFKLRLAIISALVMFVVALAVTGTVASEHIWDVMRFSLGAVVVGTGAVWLVENPLGRIKYFRSLLGVPDFSGRWEGWYYSDDTERWEKAVCEISQQTVHVTVVLMTGPQDTRKSIATAIIVDSHKEKPELVWNYYSNSKNFGTYFLRLIPKDGGKILKGHCIHVQPTDQERVAASARGIVLKLTKRPQQNDFRTDQDNWEISREFLREYWP
jgi:SMODS-associating 2TM, beta-strand rich effector domain